MADSLPDELIKEILSPALKVSDEAFSNTSPTSPFASYLPPSSAFLLVSKSWLRVATPLLYYIVVLRSKAQAQALEGVLRENKQLGTFIKKLRLEGGYGTVIHQIITSAPNLTDLFLSFNIWSSDSVSGLCKGLPIMNPIRIILCDTYGEKSNNAQLRQLVKVFCECIETWTNLETFYYPYVTTHTYCERAKAVAQALSKSPNLKTLIIRRIRYTPPLFLHIIAQNPSLRSIRVIIGHERVSALEAAFTQDKRVQSLLEFEYPTDETRDECEATPSLGFPLRSNSSFIPLKSTPVDIQEYIWDRVIYFVALMMEEDMFERRSQNSEEFDETMELNGTACHILLVSKMFHKLGVPHFYNCVALGRNPSLDQFANCLANNPSLGAHVYSLFIHSWQGPSTSAQLRTTLSYTTNLKRLACLSSREFSIPRDKGSVHVQYPVLDFRGLSVLARAAGSSLIELSGHAIARPSGPQSPDPLYSFTALRTLEWQSPAKFKFRPKDVPSGALAKLENLSYVSVNDSLLKLLECMELSALRHVSFPVLAKMEGAESFLKQHGSKILTLEMEPVEDIFDLCPVLTLLVVLKHSAGIHLHCTTPHTSLRKIIFMKEATHYRQIKESFLSLKTVDLSIFPNLQEIQVYTCQWPTNERDINKGPKSLWVSLAEDLLRWNVKLTDKAGKHWTPRLK